jgi:hypothetical protein
MGKGSTRKTKYVLRVKGIYKVYVGAKHTDHGGGEPGRGAVFVPDEEVGKWAIRESCRWIR